jgi:outer membrane protein OmpA-like peptidoglycan-associated protein
MFNTALRGNTNVVGSTTNRTTLVPNVLGTVRYEFGKREGITVEPIVMLRSSQNQPIQFDIAALASWKQILFVSAGYRSANVFTNTAGINGSVGVRMGKRVLFSYGIESLIASFEKDNYLTPFGLTHDILLAYKFGDVGKEEESSKIKDMFDRLDKQDDKLGKVNARIDSLGKTHDERIAALESKPEPVDKTKELGDRVGQLNNRVGQVEKDVKDLQNRPTTTTTTTPNYTTTIPGFSGNATKLETVYFNVNSSELTAAAKKELKAVASSLEGKRSNLVVYVTGNASAEGDKSQNMLLSMERSAVVKSYLEKLGVKQPIFVGSVGEASSNGAVSKDRRVDIFTIGE